MDKEFLESVLDALDYLTEKWDQEVDDKSLRLTSPILRRLITYGDLGRAWREVGFPKEPTIIALDLKEVISNNPIRRIDFAAAGGALYKGVQLDEMVVLDMSGPSKPVEREIPYKPLGVSAFQRSDCLLITRRYPSGGMKQEILTRGELITFFANKLGGAHYDAKRNSPKEELLDWFLKNGYVMVGDKRVVYFELLSIGQSIINSPDIVLLGDKLRELL